MFMTIVLYPLYMTASHAATVQEEGHEEEAGRSLRRGEALFHLRIEKGKLNMLRRHLRGEQKVLWQAEKRFNDLVINGFRKPESKKQIVAIRKERARAAGGVGEDDEEANS